MGAQGRTLRVHGILSAAYKKADAGTLYESVDHVVGGKQRAYALENRREYFAELSEAYFGKNDIYPFTRSDLKCYDPEGYRVVEMLWARQVPASP